MIRSIGKSCAIALAMVLSGTFPGALVARGQSGFVDDDSHIPPSPSSESDVPIRAASASLTSSIEFGAPIAAVTPLPALSSPASAATVPSATYSLTRLPHLLQRHAQTSSASDRTASPPPSIRSSGSKVGPFGVGGRRPEPARSTTNPNLKVTPLGQVPVTGSVKPTSHFDDVDQGFPPPAPPPPDPSAAPAPLFMRPGARTAGPGPGMVFPTDRGRPPTIMGSHLGLQPGETATERSLRLMSAVGELEQQLDGMSQQNAELNQHLKQREDQLLLAIREIKSARKEVSAARDELEHLRQQVKLLQDKVHDADRDNAALLQTMAPLLQKLLETDATRSDPDPVE